MGQEKTAKMALASARRMLGIRENEKNAGRENKLSLPAFSSFSCRLWIVAIILRIPAFRADIPMFHASAFSQGGVLRLLTAGAGYRGSERTCLVTERAHKIAEWPATPPAFQIPSFTQGG